MFEHSLIQQRKQSSRLWLSMPAAVVIHVAVLGSVAFGSYWSVKDVAEPQIAAVFFSERPLPPLPKGEGGEPQPKPVRNEAPKPEVKAEQTVQPQDVPSELPETQAPIEDLVPVQTVNDSTGVPDGSEEGVPEGSREGRRGGVEWGNEEAVAPQSPAVAEPAESRPVQFGIGMTRPEIVHQVQPRYTEVALKARIEGTVVIEAVIDEQGRVVDTRVLRSLPMGLDRIAVEAVGQWRFTPATLQNRPVKVFYTLTVNFRIQR